jgi:hypothetical protein
VQSGKTASGGCSAGQGSSEPVAPRIIIIIIIIIIIVVAATAVAAAVIPQAFEYNAKKSVRLCIIQSVYLHIT